MDEADRGQDLFTIGELAAAFTLSPREVASVFEVPLDHLLDPANQIEQDMMWRGTPRKYWEIRWEDRRVWGETAAMIVNLSRRLAGAG